MRLEWHAFCFDSLCKSNHVLCSLCMPPPLTCAASFVISSYLSSVSSFQVIDALEPQPHCTRRFQASGGRSEHIQLLDPFLWQRFSLRSTKLLAPEVFLTCARFIQCCGCNVPRLSDSWLSGTMSLQDTLTLTISCRSPQTNLKSSPKGMMRPLPGSPCSPGTNPGPALI